MRATWLADVLRAAGCKVREVPGWQQRGKELVSVEAVIWHHTATGPSWTDRRVQDLLVDGRSDLAGPLSQLGLERDGTFVVVAAGKANHNGYGEWGNQAIGIEAYNSGTGEPWPAVQVDAFDRGTAAILAHLGRGADRCKGHKETDPRRKIDPAGIDMNQARQRVAHLITYRPPTPAPTPEPEGWLMALTDEQQDDLYAAVMDIKASIGDAKDGTLVTLRRHLIDGPDPKPGATRAEMTWPQRVIESLRRIEYKD